MKTQCTCQGAQTLPGESGSAGGLLNLQEGQTVQSPASTTLLTPSSASLPNAHTPSQQSQPTCCLTCCPTCADSSNPDHYRHTLTLNPALFRFLNHDATRMSQEIDHAWNNETEQEKLKYEVQALREKEAMDLEGFPDFRYTKSLAFGTTTGGGGGNGGDEGVSQVLEGVSLGDGVLKKERPKDDAPSPASLAR